MRISYVNGQYVPHAEAAVSIDDRGYQFADGVYEVIAYYNRMLVDGDLHLMRLERSLAAIGIPMPMTASSMAIVLAEVIRRNGHDDGMIYLQVTRGVAKRDHVFKAGLEPQLVITAARLPKLKEKEYTHGTACISSEDIRWKRRDIKSIALLPNMLLKNMAASDGKREAWLTDAKGYITEGSVSNVYIITAKNVLVTRGEEECLLGGITRHRVLALAREAGMKVEERAFTLAEAKRAKEAFLTSTTAHVVPVVLLDGIKLGDGKPGKITQQLIRLYDDYVYEVTGKRLWP